MLALIIDLLETSSPFAASTFGGVIALAGSIPASQIARAFFLVFLVFLIAAGVRAALRGARRSRP